MLQHRSEKITKKSQNLVSFKKQLIAVLSVNVFGSYWESLLTERRDSFHFGFCFATQKDPTRSLGPSLGWSLVSGLGV